MSALGQKPTSALHKRMFALRLKATEIADIVGRETTRPSGTFANESFDLSSLRSQGTVKRFGLARVETVLEIPVTMRPRAARALRAAVHAAPCPPCYCRRDKTAKDG